MDRLISLLAALVALIALGGALLIHNNADSTQQRLAAEIAELRATLGTADQNNVPQSAAASSADDGVADALLALQSRIVTLEELTRTQASALEATRTALTAQPVAPATDIALAQPAQGARPAALTDAGPTTDCIPLGTRFMATTGDSLPICKTRAVIDVTAVGEGTAIIRGPGSVVVGSIAQLDIEGCSVSVLSADLSGYAEMRVTCL